MTKIKFLLWLLIPAFVVFTTSCGGEQKPADDQATADETVVAESQTEFDMLVKHIESTSNLVNKEKADGGAPTMIKATAVKEEMGGNIHIIDLRDAKAFSEGAIEGSVNVKLENLMYYLQTEVEAASFDKIVMVCYTGQTAGFATSVLRVMGYDNVYDMKWGMCSWNKKFADRWSTKPADLYAEFVDATDNAKAEAGASPELMTGMETAEEILEARAQEVLGMGFGSARVKVDELFADPSQFYIVNYMPKDRYDVAHIQGAVQYTPSQDLSSEAFLNTLPTEQPIVVYCYTGQHSAFVAAYLRLLGYDAYSLLYGANSFMNSTVKENGWTAFKADDVHDYPTVESEYIAPAEGEESGGGC